MRNAGVPWPLSEAPRFSFGSEDVFEPSPAVNDGHNQDALLFHPVNHPILPPEKLAQARVGILRHRSTTFGEFRCLLHAAENAGDGQGSIRRRVLSNKLSNQAEVKKGALSPFYFSSHRANRFLTSSWETVRP